MPTAERNGVRLYYTDRGEGPAVLFHTGGGGDGRMWELAGYTAALTGCRQLVLDHRGHGRSDRPPRPEDHRLDEYAADVIAVLDAAGEERASLVGYSAGATVAYRTAASRPERCAAVVGIGGLPPRGEDASGALADAARIRRAGTRAYIEDMAAGESEPAPAAVDNLGATEAEMLALLVEAWAGTDPWADLAAIGAPTLIVCGEAEDGGRAERAAATMADGTAVVLPGFGHLQAFWHGEVTGPIVRDFLRSRRLIEPGPGVP